MEETGTNGSLCFKVAERMDCDSAKSRERKDLYCGWQDRESAEGRLPLLRPSKSEWDKRPDVKKGE